MFLSYLSFYILLILIIIFAIIIVVMTYEYIRIAHPTAHPTAYPAIFNVLELFSIDQRFTGVI